MGTKVLIIGLDGVSFKVIHSLIKKGFMPNIARLIEKSANGKLRSTIPPVSGTAWHAFKTGKNPGKTGIYDFVKHSPKKYTNSIINFGKVSDLNLWNIVERQSDYSIGIYNLPTTYPPTKVNGFMVSGFPIPDSANDYTFPLELKNELNALTGGHKTDIRYRDYVRHEDFLKEVNAIVDQRVKVYSYLKDKYDPEFFIFTFTCPDRVQHRMWKYFHNESDRSDLHFRKYQELLYNFWQHLDKAVGELLKSVEDSTTIIIISDHGFGSQSEIFYVNQWLYNKGYLKLKEGRIQEHTIRNFLFQKTQAFTRSAMIKSLPIKIVLNQFTPKSLKRALKRGVSFESMLTRIDWGHTLAYSPPHTSIFGTIYLNLKGREGKGVVDPTLYKEVRKKIACDLELFIKQLPHFFIRVYNREDLYHGGFLSHAPDLIYIINNFRCITRPSLTNGSVFQSETLGDVYSGTHRLDGIFIIKSPQIKQGYRLNKVTIIDITPTILHILKLPIPDDVDGKVLKKVFKPDSQLAKREIKFTKVSRIHGTDEIEELQDDSVRKRLEDLGYL